MCGIGGWIGPDNDWKVDEFKRALQHRGPDGSGACRINGATLIHTRLAIIDISETGAQPMIAEDGKHAITYNGEIYNYRDIKKDLIYNGEKFKGTSDSEVLLRLLMREDERCLPFLAGMFSFCYWNSLTGEALLARDAFGIKPLYYRIDGKTLVFASESRILRKPDDPIDVEALRDFLLWGSVPEPKTLYLPIRQVPAGCYLHWSRGKLTIKKWHIEDWENSLIDQQPAIGYTEKKTRQALEESLQRHLVSDVPIGIFLSGGIDSTAILALTRKTLGLHADIRTFSIGFDDPSFDESSLAKRTAEHFNTRHTEWRMTAEDGVAEIAAFLQAVDQPSIDGFNTWCVSKLAASHGMKVVLSGLGGDEWFSGYDSFHRVPMFQRLYRRIGPLRHLIACLLNTRHPGSRWRRLAAFLYGKGSLLEAYHVQRGIFNLEEANEITKSLTGLPPNEMSWDVSDLPGDPPSAVSYLELTRYMRNQLLRDSDVFSMAHGLELRVPLVDIRLAGTILSINPTARLKHGKKLFTDAVPEIPEWVLNQPKRGFRFPFQQWIESRFGSILSDAQIVSPVRLNTWYRKWALASALHALQ